MIINNNVHAFSNLYATNLNRQSENINRNQKSFRDEMIISQEAQSFKDMLRKIQSESEIRQDKVEEYSRMIEEGSYSVESENIAAGILMNIF